MRPFIVAIFLLGLLAAPASAQFQSSNVSLLRKLPASAGAIGARFSEDGTKMYVTSAAGLQIYDISQADQPKLLSLLPLPHFENEDVDVGRDTVVITNDPSFSGIGAIYLIDVSDPAAPALRSVLPTSDTTQNGHVANCIAGCDYLYTTGTAEGLAVYDIRDLAAPRFVKTIPLPGDGFTHDVHVDAAGVAWVTGEDGTFGFDVSDPLNPALLYRSDPSIVNTGGGLPGDDGSGPLDFLHHNMLRTSINLSDAGELSEAAKGQGNVLAITEEDYLKPGCEGQGSLQTWRITDERNPDGSIKLELLDLWTTELNELIATTGRSPATVNCSAHWFDEQGGVIAQGWYDQGVRFLDISNPRDIKQVGYYATLGTFWAAYFAPGDPGTVYGLDVASGIDVLHFDRGGPARRAPITTGGAVRFGKPSSRWGFACPLAI
ncbi:hypothetical protein OJ998_13220 [Solirubrobacter taibaiensis]|nr:hypothetical protein [Solirubrobacter taibaiensis]